MTAGHTFGHVSCRDGADCHVIEPAPLPAAQEAAIGVPPSQDRPLGSAGGAQGTLAMRRYYLKAAGEQ